MVVEARKFPNEIQKSFSNQAPNSLEFLKTLAVKFEPFAVPLTHNPDQNDIRGFEMLAYGPGGVSYGALLGQAKAAGVSKSLLGIALFKVALLSAEALTCEMEDQVSGQVSGKVLEKLVFTFNVNGPMLKEGGFAKILNAMRRPAYSVMLEASEDLTTDDVKALRHVLDQRKDWLKLALDDSDQLAHDTRVLLENRVKLVKADGQYVSKLYRDKEQAPDFMLSRLLDLRQDSIPFVAEGIETEAMKYYLHDRWNVNAHSELWMQGWHIQVPEPWASVLEPINPDRELPKAYVLLAVAGEDSDGKRQPPKSTGSHAPDASSLQSLMSAPAASVGRDNVDHINTGAGADYLPNDDRAEEDSAFVRLVRDKTLESLNAYLPLKCAVAVELQFTAYEDETLLGRLFGQVTLEHAVGEVLRPAAETCQRELSKGSDAHANLWDAARAVLAWLCVGYVKPAWAKEATGFLQSGEGYFEIPVMTDLGVEILSSRHRQAKPALLHDATGKAALWGADRLPEPMVVASYDLGSTLKDLQLEIWKRVVPEQSRAELTEYDLKALNARLRTLEKHKEKHHYLVCPRSGHSPLDNPDFMSKLLESLSNLRVIRMVTPTESYLVTADEFDLQSEVISFLELSDQEGKRT